MGLLTLLRKLKRTDNEARILVLGLDNSGKTTILKKLSEEDISHIMPTQGFNIKSLMQDGFKLNVWDIGGQKSIRPYWRNYFDQTDALVYVIDSADSRRMEETATELGQLAPRRVLRSARAAARFRARAPRSSGSGAARDARPLGRRGEAVGDPRALLREQVRSDERQEEEIEENVNPVLKGRNFKIQKCSAKTGVGLQDGMEWLVDQLNNGAD
ncbi:GTP binding protein [Aureococcus anophagefferens]|nr:GTP binding protein [Aureococcus anophagefferens]